MSGTQSPVAKESKKTRIETAYFLFLDSLTAELQESLRKQGLKLLEIREVAYSADPSCKKVYENKD